MEGLLSTGPTPSSFKRVILLSMPKVLISRPAPQSLYLDTFAVLPPSLSDASLLDTGPVPFIVMAAGQKRWVMGLARYGWLHDI